MTRGRARSGAVRASFPRPVVGPGQLGLERRAFTVAQDTRRTYLGHYWSLLGTGLQVFILWAASRLLTTGILAAYASVQEDTWQVGAQPDLWTFSTIWDAGWYERIIVYGYPSELPVDEDGRITENAWAFMPVYPLIVRLVMLVTTLPFEIAAVLVSLAFGLASAYLVHRLFRLLFDANTAMFGLALFLIAPLSPLLQLGYAESMQLFLVAALLVLLLERRWALMVPVIIVASLTRPTGLAWAFTLALYFAYRWWQHRRGRDRFSGREQAIVAGLTALSVLAGFAWLLLAWAVTGIPTAYLDTELAWRAHYTGPGPLIPFTAWFHGSYYWVGWFGTGTIEAGSAAHIGLSIVLTVLVAGGLYAGIAAPAARRLGVEVRLWLFAYLTYLVAVFFPQSSLFRLLLPMFPGLGLLALPRSPLYRLGVVAASILGQLVWIHLCWFVIGHDWTPP